MKILNKYYNIKSNLNKKIVHISDIHYYNFRDIKKLNKVLDNIRLLNPDYICITGDLTDQAIIENEDLLLEWVNKLSIICKVIISLGNHEFYYNRYKKIFKLNHKFLNKIKKINNVYFLDNNNVIIDDINFIGLTLPIECYSEDEESIKKISVCVNKIQSIKNKFNILLCHCPIGISECINNNYDLILCGHTHGGAVLSIFRKIFKNNGFISPNKKMFPKNVYGYLEDKKIIITSGITVLSKKSNLKIFDFLFNSEIVCINLSSNF